MQYKTRVPVCGAIMLNDTWDKVGLRSGSTCTSHLRKGCFLTAVRPGQGLEIVCRMGFPEREDQRAGTQASMCNPRGKGATH